MKLDYHIVSKLLTEDNFATDCVIEHAREIDNIDLLKSKNLDEDLNRYRSMYQLLGNDGNRNYYITKSVVEHMDLFDTKKCMSADGWKIFKSLPDFKKTFILPDHSIKEAPYGGSRCLRIRKSNGVLQFFHLDYQLFAKEERTRNIEGRMGWVMLYIDMDKGELCDHLNSKDGQELAPFLYALMCFVELCDNQVVEVKPKAKWGTQKERKFINVLPFPVTVINNTWNIKTIVTDGFPVRGHVALRWTGAGRTTPKIVYIEPYQKEGYTRRSGKELANA